MSSSTPQGPGPQYGSNPDATPIDEDAAAADAVDREAAALDEEGDDGIIDLGSEDAVDQNADTDDIDTGSA